LIYGKIGFSIGTKYVHVELFLVGSPAASASVHGDLADGRSCARSRSHSALPTATT